MKFIFALLFTISTSAFAGLELLHSTVTLSREYDADEVISLVSLPANARIVSITLKASMDGDPNTFQSAIFIADIGTSQNPDVFGSYQALEYGLQTAHFFHKESSSSSLQLKIRQQHFSSVNGTQNVTGETIETWVMYVQE
jgi:hypothetical protein